MLIAKRILEEYWSIKKSRIFRAVWGLRCIKVSVQKSFEDWSILEYCFCYTYNTKGILKYYCKPVIFVIKTGLSLTRHVLTSAVEAAELEHPPAALSVPAGPGKVQVGAAALTSMVIGEGVGLRAEREGWVWSGDERVSPGRSVRSNLHYWGV